MGDAVLTEGLGKRFGAKQALDGLDLAVPEGSVLGLLGPNGAGKTTAVRVLSTLLRPDAGRAVVAGHDVRSDPGAVRRAIGLTGQHTTVDDILTGRENLVLWGRLFHLDARTARRRAEELLEQFGLGDAADPRRGSPHRAAGRRRRPGPGGEARLGRHARAPRRGQQPGARPAGVLPRRADHRPGPAQPR